ncbi:MAG: beta strand repeat-containing protein, partial [Chitinophagaceae bacterium]
MKTKKICTLLLPASQHFGNSRFVTSKNNISFIEFRKYFLPLVLLFSIVLSSSVLSAQRSVVKLPTGNFTNFAFLSSQLFLNNANSSNTNWVNDNLTLDRKMDVLPAVPADPTSNSPQCVSDGVTLNFNGSAPAGETWYWQTSATGTSTSNSASNYTVTVAGTYFVRAQDNTTLDWSDGAGSVTISFLPDVEVPVFVLGATSSRCQAAGAVTYTASASNATEITYSLDATSLAYGNTINATTGEVTFAFNWNGSSTITASAAGCNGPLTSDHEVEIFAFVNTPVFDMGPSTTRCQGAVTINYNATADNAISLTYSLDATSLAAGNTIDANTGDVTFAAGWSGTSVITVEASGCNGPKSATHTIDITPSVDTPVFTLGLLSSRCRSSSAVTYTANAANNTGLSYTLDAASIAAGLSINSSTGSVDYNGGWRSTCIITATATGCNGPKTATHTATTNDDVEDPVFALGSNSSRCSGAATITYSATANYTTGITYNLDASSSGGGNTINSSTGAVTYAAGWSGTTTITATAAGCKGPKTKSHTVTITPSVAAPVFALGSTSVRCKSGGTVTYSSTAANSTGITYSLDAASIGGGLSINASTGAVSYLGSWTGVTIVTATSTGCNGPASATHTITTNGDPVFVSGATSIRCQGAGSVTYSASSPAVINFTLDAASISGGNTINSSSGAVTYAATWSGTTTITATPSGCGGASAVNHVVTITPTVGTPVFTLGAVSSRCIGAATITYTANATNNTGLAYSLDAASISGGNTINTTTGAVTYDAAWTGTSTITATAQGCNGPKTANHVVTTNANVSIPIFTSGASSFRCLGAGSVTYSATASNSTGITYSLDGTSLIAGNTINATTGAVSYTLLWVGTSTITASAAGCSGPQTAIHTVTINGAVTTPVFTLGASSTRCQGAGTVTYTANSNNTSGITYSLDAGSITGGNTINAATGAVTYVAGWSGTTTITASASGCNGPRTANHTVTVTPTVGIPVFTLGSSSTRCQGAGTVTYTATASNSTLRTYSLDASSISGGNSINSSTGIVTYSAGWSGTSVVTVVASGCNGPSSSTHTVTITASVATPTFTAGATSIRCQGAGSVIYDAVAAYTTGITYSLNAASISGGNTINASTGSVAYAAGWSGTSSITASAAGCNGPRTATHTVTITPTVATPAFTLGATSVRCQGANTVTYTANAANNTGITYSLDASSISGGNTINAVTGAVTYIAGWTGSSVITASAAGCGGPKTANHTVTINTTVGATIFTLGATTTRCQGAGSVT